jgi:phosphinothricin acetyltransferase
MLIRHAEPERDAAACAAIYAPAVIDGVASLEEHPPDAQEMAERIARVSTRYPWLVAYDGDQALGYAYATEHRSRAAYRWAADSSVYIAPAHQRRGAGRRLYETLFDLLYRQGLYTVCAGITLPNAASIGLHERLGFRPAANYEQIGFKFGRWRSVGWWQLRLREAVPGEIPAEPGPPTRLT